MHSMLHIASSKRLQSTLHLSMTLMSPAYDWQSLHLALSRAKVLCLTTCACVSHTLEAVSLAAPSPFSKVAERGHVRVMSVV